MTTITVEIDRDKDLDELKGVIDRLGLRYQVGENDGTIYTSEIKNILDNRYDDYVSGKVELIDEGDSKKRVQAMLDSQKR